MPVTPQVFCAGDGGDGRHAVAAQGAEGFEIGLDACAAAAVGRQSTTRVTGNGMTRVRHWATRVCGWTARVGPVERKSWQNYGLCARSSRAKGDVL